MLLPLHVSLKERRGIVFLACFSTHTHIHTVTSPSKFLTNVLLLLTAGVNVTEFWSQACQLMEKKNKGALVVTRQKIVSQRAELTCITLGRGKYQLNKVGLKVGQYEHTLLWTHFVIFSLMRRS